MTPDELIGSARRSLVVMAVALVLLACEAGEVKDPDASQEVLVPLFYIHLDSDGMAVREAILAEFRKAGIEPELVPFVECERETLPSWVDTSKPGVLVYVRKDEEEKARATRERQIDDEIEVERQ